MIFAAFASVLQLSAASAKEVEVVATGSADTEEWALNRALDNAVKQSAKVKISRNTPMVRVKNGKSVSLKEDFDFDETPLDKKKGKFKGKEKDKKKDTDGQNEKNNYKGDFKSSSHKVTDISPEIIDAEYQGTVLSYKVEKTEVKDGNYYVTVKAKVEVEGDYTPKLNLNKSEVKIAVAPFDIKKSDMDCAADTTASEVGDLLVKDIIKALSNTGKVQVVERYDFTAYNKEAEIIALGGASTDSKKILSNIATADYILTGSVEEISVKVKQDGIAIMNAASDRTTVKMKVSFRLIETATMEIVYASEAEEMAIKKGGSISCDTAVANMMKIVPQIVAGKVVMKLYPDYKAEVISRRDFKEKYFSDNLEEDEEYEDKLYQEYLDKTENGFSHTSVSRSVYRKSAGTEKKTEKEIEKPVVKLPMDM